MDIILRRIRFITMESSISAYLVSFVSLAVLLIVTVALAFLRWKNAQEQALLKAEQRRSQQLGLLEEAGRIIADSFDEKEILQRAIASITTRFGYAISAISKLVEGDMLEVVVIAGTEDFGYNPGYQQKMGVGIIGHTAEVRKTYVTENVSKDPYYFSSDEHFGSAICTPLFKGEKLFGVLYVESQNPNDFDDLDVKTMETLAAHISASLHRASLYAETQENLHVLSIIQNISRTIASSLEKEKIANQVVTALKEAFGYTHISIYFLEEDYLHLAAETGYPKEMVIEKIHISQGVSGRAIRTKTVQFIEDTSKEDIFLRADHAITSEICVPLLKEDTVLGTLNIESSPTRKLTLTDAQLLTAVASPLAIAIDNARLHEQIKKMATTDAVTGLSNRHVFEQTLAAEVERTQRLGMNVSLIIFDIDDFKEFNDTYGHPAGDARLKGMAEIIKSNLRKYDIAARYGGDEFAIILSNSNEQNALAFAKRLHEAAQIGAPNTTDENAPGYTLSIGLATFPQDAANHNELLIAADHAAMRAKHLGKNQIKLASDTGK
ncbi:MAG: diguanylate cyclase [Anaerolineales bacterium]|nr:diguanylate cyclase [Anaerolineales bacterium]